MKRVLNIALEVEDNGRLDDGVFVQHQLPGAVEALCRELASRYATTAQFASAELVPKAEPVDPDRHICQGGWCWECM